MPIHVNIPHIPEQSLAADENRFVDKLRVVRLDFLIKKKKKNGSISILMAYRKPSKAAAQYKECTFNLK